MDNKKNNFKSGTSSTVSKDTEFTGRILSVNAYGLEPSVVGTAITSDLVESYILNEILDPNLEGVEAVSVYEESYNGDKTLLTPILVMDADSRDLNTQGGRRDDVISICRDNNTIKMSQRLRNSIGHIVSFNTYNDNKIKASFTKTKSGKRLCIISLDIAAILSIMFNADGKEFEIYIADIKTHTNRNGETITRFKVFKKRVERKDRKGKATGKGEIAQAINAVMRKR